MKIEDVESEREGFEALELLSKQTMELTAKINWHYFKLLQEEGFTEDQAMQMVLAGQKDD